MINRWGQDYPSYQATELLQLNEWFALDTEKIDVFQGEWS